MHQLSHKDSLHFYEPSLFADFEGRSPVAIATGDGHSLVLTDTGEVFTFGRGKEGQLGHGQQSSNCKEPQVVSAIQNETVVSIAAGSLTSYAVTATGKVYQWGLIHRDSPRALDDHEAAASGQLTGMAADQANTVVQVDHEARAHRDHVSDQASPSSAGSRASNGQNRNASAAPRARVLRDIVLDSTERWMLANDGADQEYYRELKSIGYQNEEVEQMMQNRGREYHGMLRMGCRRAPCFVPELIHLPLKVRIASVAAGYAHCMLLTVHGQLYGAGYNDRGQLGLGYVSTWATT
jgi:alpha-tubulin suppressor-like RCC1 family protein